MTSIDPSAHLSAALQAQLAALRERARAAGTTGTRAPAMQQGRVAPSLAERVAAIAPDDPDRRRQAVRLFLQSELLREFGGDLLNDPQFGTMLDAVQAEMAQDEKMAAAVDSLGDLLLAGTVRPW